MRTGVVRRRRPFNDPEARAVVCVWCGRAMRAADDVVTPRLPELVRSQEEDGDR